MALLAGLHCRINLVSSLSTTPHSAMSTPDPHLHPHALDAKHPMDPSIARQREQAAREKVDSRTEEKQLEVPEKSTLTAEERKQLNLSDNINARLENPLAGISHERLIAMGRAFALEKGLEPYTEQFEKGAVSGVNFWNLRCADIDILRSLSPRIHSRSRYVTRHHIQNAMRPAETHCSL